MKTSFFVLIYLVAINMVFAQPTQPFLSLENGMHTAKLRNVATDAEGKYLLTGSSDKTARLWDALTGKLLKTFRIPIGEKTNEGKIYACALSGNGSIAALGGLTGYEWEKLWNIYIINTQTGKMIHRIKNLPNSIFDLKFSMDGKWLAAGLWGGGGVRIFDTHNWSETKKLEGYTNVVNSIAFDRNGRLAVSCQDGKLRIYNSSFNLVAQENLVGKEPMSIAFNPSGSLLAIGYDNYPSIEVRSGKDLALLYEPVITNANTMDSKLEAVGFSADGSKLYAGGFYVHPAFSSSWQRTVRIWNNAGNGNYADLPLMQNSILAIIPIPNGNMAVISSYPELAVISTDNNVLWHLKAENFNFANNDKSHFRVNNAATIVGFTPLGLNPITFDIGNRSVMHQASLFPSPTDNKMGIKVSNWLQTFKPSINFRTVDFLLPGETCNCVDVDEDGKEVVIGSAWSIYKTDASGKMIWKTALPDAAFAVNISGNNKVVVAAITDGTIRWYRMTDGKELLALNLNSDGRRWVLFTPSGYYDASPGGEDLLGWHVNNGADETASFYPASRFRNQFYRPDVIDAVLETYDEKQGIALANSHSSKIIAVDVGINEKLPPIVTITAPTNGGTVNNEIVNVNYTIKTPDKSPVRNVKVLVNGRPVAFERGMKLLPSNDYTVNVTIPKTDCTITLLAENEYGVSPEANLYLKYKELEKPSVGLASKPNLYVLTIGISDYQNADYKLKFAAADATAFAQAFLQQKGKMYGDVIVKSLIDIDATKGNIEDGLEWIEKQTTKKDVAMIFYAGHGINDGGSNFYMLPVEADVVKLRKTCLNFEELKQTVSNIAGKVVVFIDACHSGNVMGSSFKKNGTNINSIVNELSSSQNGAVTFTSSTGSQNSLEYEAFQHGVFTKVLLDGLNGAAVIKGKNKISIKSLDLYLSEKVSELTKDKQNPTSVVPANVPDFQIAVWP